MNPMLKSEIAPVNDEVDSFAVSVLVTLRAHSTFVSSRGKS